MNKNFVLLIGFNILLAAFHSRANENSTLWYQSIFSLHHHGIKLTPIIGKER